MEAAHRLDDPRKAVGQIVALAAIESNSVAVLASDNPEAVVLDLMKPERSRRGTRGGHGQARRDESRRQGTHQRHAG